MLDGEKNWWVDPEFKILSALEKFEMWYFSGDAWRAKLTSTVLLISWITAQQLQDLCHRLQYLLDGCSWSHSDSQINPNWVIYNKGKSIHQEISTLWFYQTLFCRCRNCANDELRPWSLVLQLVSTDSETSSLKKRSLFTRRLQDDDYVGFIF